jgi:hypothetical protein
MASLRLAKAGAISRADKIACAPADFRRAAPTTIAAALPETAREATLVPTIAPSIRVAGECLDGSVAGLDRGAFHRTIYDAYLPQFKRHRRRAEHKYLERRLLAATTTPDIVQFDSNCQQIDKAQSNFGWYSPK